MTDWYATAIRTLCEQAGIQDWQTVIDTQQIEADGYAISLFPHPPGSTSMMIYVELTRHPIVDETTLLQYLLEANIATTESRGAFALIPGRRTVAYRSLLEHANTLTGERLMARIRDLLACATSEFHRVMSQRSDCGRVPPLRHRTSPLHVWSRP